MNPTNKRKQKLVVTKNQKSSRKPNLMNLAPKVTMKKKTRRSKTKKRMMRMFLTKKMKIRTQPAKFQSLPKLPRRGRPKMTWTMNLTI